MWNVRSHDTFNWMYSLSLRWTTILHNIKSMFDMKISVEKSVERHQTAAYQTVSGGFCFVLRFALQNKQLYSSKMCHIVWAEQKLHTLPNMEHIVSHMKQLNRFISPKKNPHQIWANGICERRKNEKKKRKKAYPKVIKHS